MRWQILALLLAPLLLFPGHLRGGWISADDHLSVHHAFQVEAGGAVRHPALSDPALQFKPLREEVVRQVLDGQAPLWNPRIFGGAPLLADGQSAPLSPATWLGALHPGLAPLWVLIWTGLGSFLLVRRLGGDGLVAGLAAMTGPYTQVWLLHPHAASFAWLPWALWCLESRRGAGLALATLGIWAGGHPETVAHALIIVGVWGLVRARERALLGLPVGVLLAAPLWLPLAAQVLDSATLGAHGGNRLQPAQLLDLLWPNFLGHPAGAGYRGPHPWIDGVLHPGLATLALALWSRRRWLLGAWVLCVVVALIGTIGPVNNARLGAEGALFVALAAGLALAGRSLPWRLGAAALVLLTGAQARWLDQGTLTESPTPAPWTETLAERVGEGRVVGLGWALQPNTGALVGLSDLRGYDLPVHVETEALMKRLDRRLVRPWFPIESVDSGNRNLLRFAAVRYVLAPEPHFGMDAVTDLEAPLEIYALEPDAPRAWLTPGARFAKDQAQGAEFVRAGHGFRESPPVEDLLERWPDEGVITPVPVRDRGSSIEMDLPPSETRHLLVLADRWAKGWRATVDGDETEILRVGGFFRGVVVEAGAERVRFWYVAPGWREGLALGLLGLIGLLGLVVLGRRGHPVSSRLLDQATR